MSEETLPRSKQHLYMVWTSLKSRTSNPSDKSYSNYGERGITVCAGIAQSYELFKRLLGPKPSPAHSVDRKNNEAGYWCGGCHECEDNGHPTNIRWATRQEQNLNRRMHSNNKSGYKGVRYYLGAWSAQITYNKRAIHLGRYQNPIEAARAYDQAAERLHGDKALINAV